jgi:hypothetical protein
VSIRRLGGPWVPDRRPKPLIEDLTAINELSLGRQHRVRIQGNDERGDGEIKTHAEVALGIVRGFELRS